jgi:hypothetical protein
MAQLRESQNVRYRIHVGQLGPEEEFPNRYMLMVRQVFLNMSFPNPMSGWDCKENCPGKCECNAPESRLRRAESFASRPMFDIEAGCMVSGNEYKPYCDTKVVIVIALSDIG